MSPPLPPPESSPDLPAAQVRRSTRRAFAGLAGGLLAAAGGAWWLRSRSLADGIPWPLRRVHRANELAGRALFRRDRRAKEFPPALAREPRPNGGIGMPPAGGWTVTVEWPGGGEVVPVGQLLAGLPRVESVTELKCVEGWSEIVGWAGVPLAAVAAARGWPLDRFAYVALTTPDGGYYVGLDAASAGHPQTLLCDTLNGEPLPADHGGPLRLVIPVKYGIKNLKWVGRVAFADTRPADYWAERGYDWYAGL
jgi:DMSO/TMAO reductase YedYZ molybdopterin-dependent catalytic subunit